MNTYTGDVVAMAKPDLEELLKREPPNQVWREIDRNLLTEAMRRELEATGRTHLSRNSACLCGSGKRFKNCCCTGP